MPQRKRILAQEHPRAWMYSVVFGTRISVTAVLILCCSFLLQPFHKVLAAEPSDEVVVEEQVVADEVKEQTADEVVDEEVEPEETEEVVLTQQEITENTESTADEVEVETEVKTTPQPSATSSEQQADKPTTTSQTKKSTSSVQINQAESTTSPTNAASTTTEESEVSNIFASSTVSAAITSSASSTTPNDSGGSANESEQANETIQGPPAPTTNQTSSVQDEIVQDDQSSTEPEETDTPATTSTPVRETIKEPQLIVNDQNYYQFSRQSCVAVGDGTYHCSQQTERAVDPNAVVFAELGDAGNLEIFLRTTKGDTRQITDNTFDDNAPYYDAETQQIVWQRKIDGRYQIVLYDIGTNKETQLTYSRTNNMEPKVADDGIVWQAWDGNDWEIMYFDGRYTDQLTDNLAQDVTPVIEDGYVLWSVLGSNEQEAKVYSLSSGETLTITGHEGGVIANPRFVLVYDTKFENGDVVTQGFDPLTGLSAPIAAQPAPDPIDIPTPDPIGEIRALLTNKSPHEDDFELDAPKVDSPDLDLSTPTSSKNISTTTLDLSNTIDGSQEEVGVEIAATSESTFELTDFDLVLTPSSTESTTKAGAATSTQE